jgi:hypothetical protein
VSRAKPRAKPRTKPPAKTGRQSTTIAAFLISLRLPPNPKLGEVGRVIELVHKHLDPLCRALGNPHLAKETNVSWPREGEPFWLGTAPPPGAKAEWPAELGEELREALKLLRRPRGRGAPSTAKLDAERRARALTRAARAGAHAKRAGKPKRGTPR